VYSSPVDPYQYQQQSYNQYQTQYNYNQNQMLDQGHYQPPIPYQPQQQYVHVEHQQYPQQQSYITTPAPHEGEMWSISQNKASYVVSISETKAARTSFWDQLCCKKFPHRCIFIFCAGKLIQGKVVISFTLNHSISDAWCHPITSLFRPLLLAHAP
jgi:hypothetical protein